MKILLLGKNGQVGWELRRSLATLGRLVCLDRQDLDITNLQAVRTCVRSHHPDVIVNAAAYTAVDKAEIEADSALAVNELAVAALAEEARLQDCWLVHYSTDYVFDGKKPSAYCEPDQALPLSVYGRTKLGGENAILQSGCKHFIFRSSWVYSIRGSNFPLAILRRAMEQDQINVVSDCFGAPTSATLIADVTAQVLHRVIWDPSLRNFVGGIYHLVASGKTSWYEYAKFLVRLSKREGIPVKIDPNRIFPVDADSYPTTAKRPRNSQLDNRKIHDQFGLVLPQWETQVQRFINELAMPRPL